MGGMSIRLRLTIWYSVVLLLGLALFGAGMSIALEHRLMSGVDEMLAQRVEGLKTTLELEGPLGRKQMQVELSEFARETAEGSLIQLFDPQGAALLPFPETAGSIRFAAGPPGYRTDRRNGREYRVVSNRFDYAGQSYQAIVASNLASVHAVMGDFRGFLLMMIPAVLVLAAAGGFWISGRALAPVDEITRVATSISLQSLSKRLVVPRTHDEIQRMSEAWNGVLERLESAVLRIQRFTADASHELRTPIALIRTTAELALRRERTGGEYQQSLMQIQSEAERMTELAESLLALARADANDHALALEPTDLRPLIDSLATQAARLAAAKGVAIRAEIEEGQLLADANEAGIRRLFLILLDNALQHTAAGGSVTVLARRTPEGVRVSIADTGAGIAPDALPHIFERFYRADQSRTGPGAGLGLAIAQTIAQAHNSVITVRSELGEGTSFSVVLR